MRLKYGLRYLIKAMTRIIHLKAFKGSNSLAKIVSLMDLVLRSTRARFLSNLLSPQCENTLPIEGT